MKPRFYAVRRDVELPDYLKHFAGMIGEVISQPYADTFSLYFGVSGSLEIPLSYLKRVETDELMTPTPKPGSLSGEAIAAHADQERLLEVNATLADQLAEAKSRIAQLEAQTQRLSGLLRRLRKATFDFFGISGQHLTVAERHKIEDAYLGAMEETIEFAHNSVTITVPSANSDNS